MHSIPTSLITILLVTSIESILSTGEPCQESNNKLDPNSHKFLSDCGPIDFCNSTTQTCDLKGCRTDEFPFGYSSEDLMPELCKDGFVCPDEESSCQPLVPLGGPCQLNRDDECASNPNPTTNSSGLAVCLHYTCILANVPLGQTCIIDNTVYSGYLPDGSLSSDVVMRDNCDTALYCDSDNLICQSTLAIGQTCQSDSHCNSSNCAFSTDSSINPSSSNISNNNISNILNSYIQQGTCQASPSTPLQISNWVCFFVIAGICLAMFGLVFGLFQMHKAESQTRREILNQYWEEQLAFRKSIIALHTTMSLKGNLDGRQKRL